MTGSTCRELGMADHAIFGFAEGADRAAEKILEETPKTSENLNRILFLAGIRVAAVITKGAINQNACNPIYLDSNEADRKVQL